jgi:hypothetical protein
MLKMLDLYKPIFRDKKWCNIIEIYNNYYIIIYFIYILPSFIFINSLHNAITAIIKIYYLINIYN